MLREYEIEQDYIQKPIIPGIECVGEVVDPSDTHFQRGERVVALMGGMGRSFHGSYAEYALLPAHHVFSVSSSLSWEDLAAVPETYYTAWGSLMQNLQLQPSDVLLVRGGTCALGYVAIQLAKALGCTVLATTHREEKLELLTAAGVDEPLLDQPHLKDALPPYTRITKVLELIGTSTLLDSLQLVSPGGIVCHTGVLGGEFSLEHFYPLSQIPNGVYLTGFHSNWPTQKDMQDILDFMDLHHLKPQKGAVYPFSDIQHALMDFDHHRINGKVVILNDL